MEVTGFWLDDTLCTLTVGAHCNYRIWSSMAAIAGHPYRGLYALMLSRTWSQPTVAVGKTMLSSALIIIYPIYRMFMVK